MLTLDTQLPTDYKGSLEEEIGFYEGVVFYTFEDSGFVSMDFLGLSDTIFFADYKSRDIAWEKSPQLNKKLGSRKGRKLNFALIRFKGHLQKNESIKNEVIVLELHELKFLSPEECKALVHREYEKFHKR